MIKFCFPEKIYEMTKCCRRRYAVVVIFKMICMKKLNVLHEGRKLVAAMDPNRINYMYKEKRPLSGIKKVLMLFYFFKHPGLFVLPDIIPMEIASIHRNI